MPQIATLQDKTIRGEARPSSSPIASPFGSSLPNRAWSDVSRGYRYGFNGMEKENDQDYFTEFRLYNPDLGRWISVDKLYKSFINSYNAFSNSPIVKIDPNGLSDYYTQSGEYLGSDGTDGTDIKIVTDNTTIQLIRKNREVIIEDNLETSENEAYYKYELTLTEGTFFQVPSYSDRQEISKIMATQNPNQRNEVGGKGFSNKEGNSTYLARAMDGGTVSDDDLKKLADEILDGEFADEDIEMPFKVNLSKIENVEGLIEWKSKNEETFVTYTWHSHPFLTVYRSKAPGSGIYTYNIDEIPIENEYSFVVIGGAKIGKGRSKANSTASDNDIANSALGDINEGTTDGIYSNKSNYVISKAAGTISHTFNGVENATLKTDFFYNTQSKSNQK